MALKGIIRSNYGRLLARISSLPDDKAQPLEEDLTALYSRYNQQLFELAKTIEQYEALATRIRARQVLRKTETI